MHMYTVHKLMWIGLQSVVMTKFINIDSYVYFYNILGSRPEFNNPFGIPIPPFNTRGEAS